MHVLQWRGLLGSEACILRELENVGLLDHHDDVLMELGTLCDDNGNNGEEELM
jgi:hypothetical protein